MNDLPSSNWTSPETYRYLMDLNQDHLIQKRLSGRKSSREVDAFIKGVSNVDWAARNPVKCVQSIKLVPKNNPIQRAKLVQAIGATGLFQVRSNEVNDLVKQACLNKDWALAKELLANIEPIALDGSGVNLLHVLARSGNEKELIQACYRLEEKGYINSANIHGETPLHIAVQYGMTNAVKLLLQLGADPNAKTNAGDTILHYACFNPAGLGPLRYLIALGGDVNTENLESSTPLFIAAYFGQAPQMNLLLEHGAKVAYINKSGLTPLWGTYIASRPFETKDLESMTRADNGLTTEIFSRKILAHYFGLSGTSVLLNREMDLERFSPEVAIAKLVMETRSLYGRLYTSMVNQDVAWNSLVQSLSPTSRMALHSLGNEEFTAILSRTIDAIASSASKDPEIAIKKAQDGELLGLATGWPGHTIGLAHYGDKIAICNRGEGATNPGIHIYTLGINDTFEESLKKCIPVGTLTFFTKEIFDELDLHDEIYIPQKGQKVANCTVGNTNSMEVALLYVQLEPRVGRVAAEEIAKAIQKIRTQDSRVGVLRDYLNYHRKPQTYPPDYELLRQVVNKTTAHSATDREVYTLIQQYGDDMNLGEHFFTSEFMMEDLS